jgi:hypothetical protein
MTDDIDLDLLPPAVRAYRPRCPGCDPTTVTSGSTRPCSYYDCPGLPDELRVTCDTCMYDFAAEDGQVKCDHATCETARRLASNVPVYRAWVALVRSEIEQRVGR